MQDAYEFRVSTKELEFLNQLVMHDDALCTLLKLRATHHDQWVGVRLNRAEAEQLGDFLTLQLAMIGFDDNYAPNEQGRIVEELIDKFFPK